MSFIARHWDTISVAVCLLMYAGTAAVRWRKMDGPMALTFAAYALANVGFIWHFLRAK
jgi:membrane protein YdbS with pleckstrin-like domain